MGAARLSVRRSRQEVRDQKPRGRARAVVNRRARPRCLWPFPALLPRRGLRIARILARASRPRHPAGRGSNQHVGLDDSRTTPRRGEDRNPRRRCACAVWSPRGAESFRADRNSVDRRSPVRRGLAPRQPVSAEARGGHVVVNARRPRWSPRVSRPQLASRRVAF